MANEHGLIERTKKDRNGNEVITYCFKYSHKGKQIWKNFGTDLKHAIRERRKILCEIDTHVHKPPTKITFETYAHNWLNKVKGLKIKRATYDTYEGIIRNHLSPCFGETNIANITTSAIRDYIADKAGQGKLSNRSINYHVVILGAIFKQAIDEDNLIVRNPAKVLTNKDNRLHETPKKTNIFTLAELRDLIRVATDPFKTYLMIAINTSMRLSEIRALQWSDIDMKERIIYIRRNIYKGLVETPKNGEFRESPINDVLYVALLDYQLNALKSANGWLFPNPKGEPLDKDQITKRWFKTALEDAGIESDVTFKSLRHTFCTLSAKVNNNQFLTQKLAGHSNIATTATFYVHLDRDTLLDASNNVANAIFSD